MKRLQKTQRKKTPYIVAALLVAAAAIAAIVLMGGGENPSQSSSGDVSAAAPNALDLGNDLSLIQVGSYSGPYVEDGSDEIVQDIMAITVKNTGAQTVQLATVTITAADGQQYTFEFTTLPPGEQLAMLEANRAVFPETLEIASATSSNVALFQEEPTMCEDMLSFTCTDRTVTVKNISGQPFSGGRVFYKNVSSSTLVGGITYMVSIPALEPDAETTLYAGHYLENGSRLMFVTYAG